MTEFTLKQTRQKSMTGKASGLTGWMLTILGWLILTCSPVLAQDSGTQLSVSPPTAFIKIKPGSRASHTITLENTGSQIVTVKPIFYDFTSDGQTGLPQLQNQFSFPYLDIPPAGFPQVQIPARSKGQLTLMVSPPLDAKEGEYAFTVVFQSEPTQDPGQTTIGQGIGSNLVVLVTAQDQLRPSLSIDAFKSPRVVDSFAPLRLEFLIKNNGPASQVASGSARLSDWQGKTITSFTLYPDIVLGNSTRAGRALQVNPQPTTDDNPYSAIDFQAPSGFRWGLYTWEVKLWQGTDNYQIKTAKVLALPLVLVILTLTGISLLIFWALMNHRKPKPMP